MEHEKVIRIEDHKRPVVESEKEKGLLLSFNLAVVTELQAGREIDDEITVLEAMSTMMNVLDDFFGRPRTTAEGFYSCKILDEKENREDENKSIYQSADAEPDNSRIF